MNKINAALYQSEAAGAACQLFTDSYRQPSCSCGQWHVNSQGARLNRLFSFILKIKALWSAVGSWRNPNVSTVYAAILRMFYYALLCLSCSFLSILWREVGTASQTKSRTRKWSQSTLQVWYWNLPAVVSGNTFDCTLKLPPKHQNALNNCKVSCRFTRLGPCDKCASEVTTLWRYTNLFIIFIFSPPARSRRQEN